MDAPSYKKKEKKGLSLIHREQRTKRGGGVGILFNKSKVTVRKMPLAGNIFEAVAACGKLVNDTRKSVIFSVYMPPSTLVDGVNKFNEFLSDNLMKIKADVDDPYINIAGNTNKSDIKPALAKSPDVCMVDTPASRGDDKLDVLAINLSTQISEIRAHTHPYYSQWD